MTLKLWLAFVAASAVLLVTPGPTILTVIGYSVSHGRRARAALIAAVALGDSTALAVSLLGLGAVLQTSAFWFSVVKFVGGLYLTALNPKGIVFFVAFLPQFIHPGVNAAQQLLVLACTFVAMAIINSTLYAYFAASARTLLASPGAQRKFTRASGSLLSIAGIWVLLARRPA